MSNRFRTFASAGVALFAATALVGCGASAAANPGADEAGSEMPEKLIVAVIPSEDRTELDASEDLAMQILSEELGMPVAFHLATSYAATIEAQRAGKAHLAQYGPFSYILAADSGVPLELVGAPVSADNQEEGYYSVASVKSGSDITSLADARGKKVCFVDPASTSGYLFPSAGLLEAGLDPVADITPVYAGGHDASVLALKDGQCDIAFSTESMVTKQLIETGQVTQGEVEQIWQSELIPLSPLAMSTALPAELREQIKSVYLDKLNVAAVTAADQCDATAEDGLCGLRSFAYLPVEDSIFDGVRAVCDVTQADACDIANQ